MRSSEVHDDVLRLLRQGQVNEALRSGLSKLERKPDAQSAPHDAVLGQTMGRALLLTGREEEAEDLFRTQLRIYESMSRTSLRWLSSLDQAVMLHCMNRPSRAAELFNAVADDDAAPAELRVEALAGLAVALRSLGETPRGERTLDYAQTVARGAGLDHLVPLLEAISLEIAVYRSLRLFESSDDLSSAIAFAANDREKGLTGERLRERLLSCATQLEDHHLVAQRLRYLALLMSDRLGTPERACEVMQWLKGMRDNRLLGAEKVARIEATLAFVNCGDNKSAQELLGGLLHDDEQLRRHRYSLELRYCVSRVYAIQGRHADALRMYKEHAVQAMTRLRTELVQMPYSRFLEKMEMADHGDAMRLMLPVRYRKAYQFITEHLDDRDLSVRQVAAQIDVTERALQMAFRSHIGMTPAELIRKKRMERIRRELRQSPNQSKVLDVAMRWGMSNRSTLAQNYRQQFGEAPTSTLRGQSAPDRNLSSGTEV